jgi:hypothetical protein
MKDREHGRGRLYVGDAKQTTVTSRWDAAVATSVEHHEHGQDHHEHGQDHKASKVLSY